MKWRAGWDVPVKCLNAPFLCLHHACPPDWEFIQRLAYKHGWMHWKGLA